MNNKELFYLVMAALGGYAAYLSIKKHEQEKVINSDIFDGAFNDGSIDFYTSIDPLLGVTGQEYLLNNRLGAI